MAWVALQLYIIHEFNSRMLKKFVKCVEERKGDDESKKSPRVSLSVGEGGCPNHKSSLTFSIISICPSHPSSVSFFVPFKETNFFLIKKRKRNHQ